MNKLVSIIIPCYNYGKYLEECVKSVINNTTEVEYEIIIVDDASKDNSFLIAKGLEQTIKNCKVIHNIENKKMSATRNVGIKLAKGDLIICLDADDLIPENYIEANYNIIKDGYDISYNDSQCFGVINKRFDWPNFDLDLLRKTNYIHVASMFKKSVWEKVGGFDESFIYGLEDYDFWLSCANAGFKFQKCKDTYLLYRRKFDCVSETISQQHCEEIKEQLRIKHKGFYLG